VSKYLYSIKSVRHSRCSERVHVSNNFSPNANLKAPIYAAAHLTSSYGGITVRQVRRISGQKYQLRADCECSYPSGKPFPHLV